MSAGEPARKKRKLPAFVGRVSPPKTIVVDPLSRGEENTKWLRDHQPPGTAGPYNSYWRQFQSFCQRESLSPLPAEPDTVISFMRLLLGDGKARGTINKAALAAISEAHRLNDLPSPTVSDWVSLAKKTITWLNPPPKTKRPLLLSHIRQMVQVMDAQSTTDTRDMLLLFLMFLGLLRESEAVSLRLEDVYVEEVNPGHPVLFVWVGTQDPTKTDQGCRGEYIILDSNPGNPLECAVSWYLRYRDMRGSHQSPFLFSTSPGNTTKMSSRAPNAILKRWVRKLGLDPAEFSSHSARHGGATAAAAEGVQERLLKRHGRWKSDQVRVYIHETLANRLGVSQAILRADPSCFPPVRGTGGQ